MFSPARGPREELSQVLGVKYVTVRKTEAAKMMSDPRNAVQTQTRKSLCGVKILSISKSNSCD